MTKFIQKVTHQVNIFTFQCFHLNLLLKKKKIDKRKHIAILNQVVIFKSYNIFF